MASIVADRLTALWHTALGHWTLFVLLYALCVAIGYWAFTRWEERHDTALDLVLIFLMMLYVVPFGAILNHFWGIHERDNPWSTWRPY